MKDAARTAILVAGMHRSGTSATAGALAYLDVSLGSRMLEPGPDNPRGYWEHERAVEIHEELLFALGRRWDDARPLPAGWREHPAGRKASADVIQLVRSDFGDACRWAVKDPRICRFLPLWLESLRGEGVRPVVLLVVRHPAEVAASLQARNGWEPGGAALLWLRYMADAVAATRATTRTVLAYPDLIADPSTALSGALARLKVSTGQSARMTLRDFVDPRARHHVASEEGARSRSMQLALDAYHALSGGAGGETDWTAATEALAAFESEWESRREEYCSLAGMATANARRVAVAATDLAQGSARLAEQVAWSEEAASKLEALQAERDEVRSQLNAQVAWSEEAASKLEALQAERDEVRSQLIAQVAWSEEAASKLEVLQAERDEVRSQLNAQVAWSEEAASKLEALQAERDEVRSQLNAQVAWSEEAASRLEALQAERDDVRSQFNAQVAWSEAAASKLEALQAERDEVRSQFNAQVAWSQEAASKLEALQAERDEVRSQLNAQVAWSEEAASRLEALQAERDEVRSQLNAQVRWAEQAVVVHRAVAEERDDLACRITAVEGELRQVMVDLHESRTHTASVERRAAELDLRLGLALAELAESRAHADALSARLGSIVQSRSWRYTQPLRSLLSRLRSPE